MSWLKINWHTLVWWLLVASLILGQLARVELANGLGIYLHDLLLGVMALEFLFEKIKWNRLPKINPAIQLLILFLFVSTGRGIIQGSVTLVSFLYLFRLLCYVLGGLQLYLKLPHSRIQKGLAVASFSILIFGFVQWLLLPDLRWLRWLGWDDHLYRLVSTYLDPAFTGLVLVFGLHTWSKFWTDDKKASAIILGLFIVGIILTTSRSSYLSLLVLIFFHYNKLKWQWVKLGLLTVAAMAGMAYFGQGEGWNLFRTSTIFARWHNAQEWVGELQPIEWLIGKGIFAQLPKSTNLLTSHTRAPDSSIILILTNLGLLGLITVSAVVLKIFTKLSHSGKALLAALIVHSQFSASLTHSFISVWIVFLLLLEFKDHFDGLRKSVSS